MVLLPSHCPYSTACRPTVPADACTRMALPLEDPAHSIATCTVVHTAGSVLASSNVSAIGFSTTSGDLAQAMVARGAFANPKTALPVF
eukprot:7389183-Prymnesium_polylepis.1